MSLATRLGRMPAKILGYAVDLVALVLFVSVMIVGIYALWDSRQVDAMASSAQWLPYRPIDGQTISFDQLKAMNNDVVAWLTVYGTNIDYPVCHSEDGDTKYIHTDALGRYSASGSLFTGINDSIYFDTTGTVVYGHHMSRGMMFGALDDFFNQEFLDEHEHGQLFASGRDWGLVIVGALHADAYDQLVYGGFGDGIGKIRELRGRCETVRADWEPQEGDRYVLMSTCSNDTATSRLVVIAKITHEKYENPFVAITNYGTGVDDLMANTFLGLTSDGMTCLYVSFILLLVIELDYIFIFIKKSRRGSRYA